MSALHDEVRAILQEECGARELDGFEQLFPECREYRFVGALGFGGKVWATLGPDHYHLHVTCYREDETPERTAMIARANLRLGSGSERLYADFVPRLHNPTRSRRDGDAGED